MKKVTIADVLHYAADRCLSANSALPSWPAGKMRYSCDAINEACNKLYKNAPNWYERQDMVNQTMKGLRKMGLSTKSLSAFDDIPFGTERQGARYAWLKFCAMLAEEQGV